MNAYDFISTKFLTDLVGFRVEANPLLRYLMEHTGTVWIVFFIKLTILAAVWSSHLRLQVVDARVFTPKVMFGLLAFLNGIYFYVCVHNTYLGWYVFHLLEIVNVQPL